MPITDYSNKSKSKPRFIMQLNVNKSNEQWINIGAGIWKMNFDASYPEVESWLLPSSVFYPQVFASIGSVTCDFIIELVEADSLDDLTINSNQFYFNQTDTIYICLENYDSPFLHNIALGVIYGYSFNSFTPVNSLTNYEGRLTGSPSISVTRDQLFFGKLQYSFGTFDLINTDGYFDLIAEDNNIYGNLVRVYFGYEELPISEYECIATGIIENISISETTASLSISDRRKTLSKSVTYTCSNKNALEVIEELLSINYKIPYTENYYNIANWEIAKALVPNITIDIGTGKAITDMKVQEIIEMICTSVLGVFIIDKCGKLDFKLIDTSSTPSTTVPKTDRLDPENSIDYSPENIISSTKVGYSKNWNEGYTSPYTWLLDTSAEADSYKNYKVYNQKEFMTVLTNLSDAQELSTTILNYFKDIHGTGTIIVPMKYYSLEITDTIYIQIDRMNKTMLGTKKCEIMGISYKLSKAQIEIKYRIV